MERRAHSRVAFSHMQILAACSVVALLCVALWQIGKTFGDENTTNIARNTGSSLPERAETPYESIDWQAPPENLVESTLAATEDPDGIGNIADNVIGVLMGSYQTLAETGSYTPKEGEKIAEDIAQTLRASVSYKTYATSDLKTDTNVSYERMLAYRNDLRIALEPLLSNPGYELSLFANYMDTHDTKYLEGLQKASYNYQDSIKNAASVVVPEDAVTYHVGILNALSEFGATIEQLSKYGDDAFAAAALLRTYNENELNLFTSFNTLATYFTRK